MGKGDASVDRLSGVKKIMIIAGEASGDLHGAGLLRSLLKKDRHVTACGVGGDRLKQAGMEILVDSAQLAVMGVTEVVSRLPVILKAKSILKKCLYEKRPDLVILIDYPGFNLHMAGVAKKAGIPVLYYISPKVWAWRSGRVKKIRAFVDHMALILPFEEAFYSRHRVPVTFVGNPLLDIYPDPLPGPSDKPSDGGTVILGLLPGSRQGEISRLLPVMVQAANRMDRRMDHIRFIVSAAPSADRHFIEETVNAFKGGAEIAVETGDVAEVFKKADFLVAASGTVTLEAAIAGIPMIIIYKMSPLSFWLAKNFVGVKHVGLASIIAGEEVVPELLQNDAEPDKISDLACEILGDAHRMGQMKKKLHKVRKLLGGPGAADKTADIALEMIKGASRNRQR